MVVGTVRQAAHKEDLYGKISPCPIPPNPSKKQPDSKPHKSSSKWYDTRTKIWTWVKSPRFAGFAMLYFSMFYWSVLGLILLLSAPWFNVTEYYLVELGNPLAPRVLIGADFVNSLAPLFNGLELFSGLFNIVLMLFFGLIMIRNKSMIGILGVVCGIIIVSINLPCFVIPFGFPLWNEIAFTAALLGPVLVTASMGMVLISLAPWFLGHDKIATILFAITIGLFTIIFLISFYGFHCTLTGEYGQPLLVFLNGILGYAIMGIFSVLFITRGDHLI